MSGGKGDRRIANANVQGSHRAIASDELATAGRLRRGAVRMHLLRGRHCRRYAAQIRAIGVAVQKRFGSQEDDPATVERLTRAILERAPETQGHTPETER